MAVKLQKVKTPQLQLIQKEAQSLVIGKYLGEQVAIQVKTNMVYIPPGQSTWWLPHSGDLRGQVDSLLWAVMNSYILLLK